jgi:hypothetical protein
MQENKKKELKSAREVERNQIRRGWSKVKSLFIEGS